MNYRIVTLKRLAAFLLSGSFSLFLAKFYPGPAVSNRATSGNRTTAEQ